MRYLIIFTVVLFFACEKEETVESIQGTPPCATYYADSIIIDSNHQIVHKVLSDGRISAIENYQWIERKHFYRINRTTYQYDSQQVATSYDRVHGVGSDTWIHERGFYHFNSKGQIDSVVFHFSADWQMDELYKETLHFTYVNGRIAEYYTSNRDTIANPYWKGKKCLMHYDGNGNLIQMETYDLASGVLEDSKQYTYDNKKNFMSNVIFPDYPLDPSLYSYEFIVGSVNNIVSVTQDFKYDRWDYPTDILVYDANGLLLGENEIKYACY